MYGYIVKRERIFYEEIPKKLNDRKKPVNSPELWSVYKSSKINKQKVVEKEVAYLYDIDVFSMNNRTSYTKNKDEAKVYSSKKEALDIMSRVDGNRHLNEAQKIINPDFYGKYSVIRVEVQDERTT